MQPLAISIMLIMGFILMRGTFILSDTESSRETSRLPSKVELTISAVFSIECGPIRLAEGFRCSTFVLSALGKQPATTRGLPDLVNDLILVTILCSVASLTE